MTEGADHTPPASHVAAPNPPADPALGAPVALHNGRFNFTKWGPIIAAAIIGTASVTGSIVASLINRSGKTTDSTVPIDSTANGLTGSNAGLGVDTTLPLISQSSAVPVTAPPQVIIVQVPGSTVVGAPPHTVIVTVTVLVTAPPTTINVQLTKAPTTEPGSTVVATSSMAAPSGALSSTVGPSSVGTTSSSSTVPSVQSQNSTTAVGSTTVG